MAFKTADEQSKAMIDYNELEKRKTESPDQSYARMKDQWRKERQQLSRFILDKEKYPDVEETPYGYVYNVGKHSITDLGGERQKIMPSHFDPNRNYGFSVTVDGDESYYPSFEEAYKRIKGV